MLFLKQHGDTIDYATYPYDSKALELVSDYFNLDIKVQELYTQWSRDDPVFQKTAVGFEGVRMLRQNPWENLISFICSSNNNVKRISQMCDNLTVHFGELIMEHEGVEYYTFPTPQALSKDDVESKLRDLSFGYRAKYIHKTAQMVSSQNQDLFKIRDLPYEEAHAELIKFVGVGPKVADCICLMSMDKHDAIPVDTHVYQIAKRDYKLSSKGDAVTPKTYELIRKFFVNKWGPYAGWAQSVMFAADLKDLENGLNQTSSSPKKQNKRPKVEVKEEIQLEANLVRADRRKRVKTTA